MSENSIEKYIKIEKKEVAFVAAFLDAFNGMFAVRTPEPAKDQYSIMQIFVSPDFETEYNKIIRFLSKEICLTQIT
jgi:hypothetical protein